MVRDIVLLMRILAMSNLEDGAERVVDALEGRDVTIVAKEYAGSTAEMCGRLSVEMEKGRYDYVVVVSDGYISASIELNKQAKLRAAVCDSDDEMKEAMVSGINVVVVRGSQKKPRFLALMAGQHARQKTEPSPVEDRREERVAEQKQHEKEAKEKKPRREEHEEESPEETGGGGKGILGRLKSQLGIVE